jgi:uncharacterized protein
MTIEMAGTVLELHPSGALFIPDLSLLIISDVHLGKVMHFRKHGMAVPAASLLENFDKMTFVADHFRARQICFLGDLFHSKINREWLFFEEWVRSRRESLVLVKGNHDIIPELKYLQIGVEVIQEGEAGNFVLLHEPAERDGKTVICGHIHPGIRLVGFGGEQIALPCFFRTGDQLILPAFGTFTGKYRLNPAENEVAYAIAGDRIVEIRGS